MNKEKFNLEKPKKEAKKHKRKSISLIDELKINQDESKEDLLPEEIEAYFWQDLYKQKLNEIKQSENFQKAAIKDLENDIKKGKNGDGYDASLALQIISSIKGLKIYKKEFKQKLNEIKQSEDFKKTVIKTLEDLIKSGKNGDGYNASWTLHTILSIKDLEIYKKEIKQKLNEIKQSEKFKKTAIAKLENNIKLGKNGNGEEKASLALQIISSIKGLKIYKKEIKQKLNEIKQSEKFKKTAIKYLENNIKLGKNGIGASARWALRTISSIKNISNYWQSIADNKQAKKARNKTKERKTFKRPELK